MKKILIVNNNMQIGGIQKALANLLSEIAPNYEITLFLLAPEGALMKEIPEHSSCYRSEPFFEGAGTDTCAGKK